MSLDRPLFDAFPGLRERLPISPLGEFPTAVEHWPALPVAIDVDASVYVKRDDRSSSLFGGNKVRTLEVLFGAARRIGATRVFATGSFGSNHAVATVVHAGGAGLEPAVVLYPQPFAADALSNLKSIADRAARFVALPHWSFLPAGVAWTRSSERRQGRAAYVMAPGGATPLGASGYVNAALELSWQVADGVLPRPARVVVSGGSGATTAGLLFGFALAARLGIGFVHNGVARPPELLSVRVTPWPVTSRLRLAGLASRTSEFLATLAGDDRLRFSAGELRSGLTVEGRYLGRGYGHATTEGADAIDVFRRAGGPAIETTYSAKSAAALLDVLRRGARGTTLYWATRSAVPPPPAELPRDVAPVVRRWADAAERFTRAHP